MGLDTADYGNEVGQSCLEKIMEKELAPALENLRPKDREFKSSLGYIIRLSQKNPQMLTTFLRIQL